MSILALILIIFVAIEHYYILILEMYFNESETIQRNFGLDSKFLKDERVKKMMANQGLYNSFLASGLIWSLTETGEFQIQIAVFFLICIICAAICSNGYYCSIVTVNSFIILIRFLKIRLNWRIGVWVFFCVNKKRNGKLIFFITKFVFILRSCLIILKIYGDIELIILE